MSNIRLDEEVKRAEVFLRPEEVSLAIGKGGPNIKLASKLTGYVIDVYRDTEQVFEEDIYLDEFKDEIETWVIDALKDMGCVTAKSVLATPRAVLIDKADLEEETVDHVLEVLRAEFDDDNNTSASDEPEAQDSCVVDGDPAEDIAAAADEAMDASDSCAVDTDPAEDIAAAADEAMESEAK